MGIMDFLSSDDSGGGSAGFGSGLIGGVLDAAIGPVMSNVQYIRGKKVSRRQIQAMMNIAHSQPSWAAEGLRRAGINPLLGVMRGLAEPSAAPRVESPDIRTGSLSEAMSRGVSSGKQMSLLNSQAELVSAEARKAKAEASVAEATASPKAWAEISEILARSGLYDEQMKTTASQGAANVETRFLTKARRRLAELDMPSSEASAEFYGTPMGGRAPVVRFLLEALKALK